MQIPADKTAKRSEARTPEQSRIPADRTARRI
jgi:hypothetical protein